MLLLKNSELIIFYILLHETDCNTSLCTDITPLCLEGQEIITIMPPGNCCPIFECSKYCAPSSCVLLLYFSKLQKTYKRKMQVICGIILGLVVNECFKATATGLQKGPTKLWNRSFFIHFCLLKLTPPSSFFTGQGCVVNETYYAVSTKSYSL